MEVILLEKIPQLGDPGDIVEVMSGYGTNFLIPTGKAIRADEENKAEYERRKEERKGAIVIRCGGTKGGPGEGAAPQYGKLIK